jgi:hypothetical protein
MDEAHICVVDRDGSVVLETKMTTFPAAIASGFLKSPEFKRIVFETGRIFAISGVAILAFAAGRCQHYAAQQMSGVAPHGCRGINRAELLSN